MTVRQFINTMASDEIIINLISNDELVETISSKNDCIIHEDNTIIEWSIIHKSYSDTIIIEVLI